MATNELDSIKPYELQCVSQALELFDVLSRTSGMLTLSRLSRYVGISKNKMFRLLATLEQHGVVEKFGEGWYRFGGMAFALARRIIVSESIMDYARPIMADLAGMIDESVYLATSENGVGFLRDMVDCSQAIRAVSFVGATFSLLHTDEDPDSLAKLHLPQYPGLRVDVAGLDADITTVSVIINENGNSSCDALVVLAPTFRMPIERIRSELAPALVSAAARLSGELSSAANESTNSNRAGMSGNINRTFDELGCLSPNNYQHSSVYSRGAVST